MESKRSSSRLLKQVMFTLMVVVLYRIGTTIPIPGVDTELLQATAGGLDESGFLGVVNLFSGGALSNASILAVGILPFITASLVFQLLNGVVPSLRELQKQGPAGQKKLASVTRIVALALAIGQAVIVLKLLNNSTIAGGFLVVDLFPREGFWPAALAVSTLTVGFLALLWIADQVGKRGIGNGLSIVLIASVVSTVVGQGQTVVAQAGVGGALTLLAVVIAALAAVVTLSQVERRIEVATVKQAGARRGRSSSYVPLRLLQAGVAPAIFAGAMIGGIGAVTALLAEGNAVRTWIEGNLLGGGIGYLVTTAALVFFFTYFYTAVQFNVAEIADDLAKRGMFIVGVRPGQETGYRLAWVLARLAVAAGLVLAAVAVLPLVVQEVWNVTNIPLLGVTLLIATSVATDTVRQLKAKQSLYDYDSIIDGDADESIKPLTRAA